MILSTCLALLPLVQDVGPDWVLVRGPRDLPAQTSFEKIGEIYLGGKPFKVVEAKDADVPKSKSRFIFGSVSDNPLAAEAFLALGGRIEEDTLFFASMTVTADAGIAIVAPDVDGKGELILMTGGSANGAFACLTARVDVGKPGWTAIEDRKVRGRGPLPKSAQGERIKLEIDGSKVSILRLDEDARHLLTLHTGDVTDEAALRVARTFRAYLDVIRAAGFENGLSYGRWLLAQGPDLLETHGEFAAKAPEFIAQARESVERALGKGEGTQPVYYVLWGRPRGTNARTFDIDRETGRLRVLLNLAALETPSKFVAAAVHETVHTRQSLAGNSLKGRAVIEGIASFLTQELLENVSEAEALMWSDAELAAAQKNEAAIREAFESASQSPDPKLHAAFLKLGVEPKSVPGAPSRTAYWLGYLAAKRWRSANPEAPLAEMLSLGVSDLFPAK